MRLPFVVALIAAAHGFDVEGGSRPSFPRPAQQIATPAAVAPQEALGTARSAVAGMTKLARRYQAFITATAKVSRGISMGCGLWLIIGTPLVLLKSGFTFRAGDAVLSLYLATFGMLMFLVEVPLGQLQKFLQSYIFFMYTRWGRAYFLVLTATTAWTLAKVGVLTKALLLFSAALSTYVMFSSPASRFGESDARAKQLAAEIGAPSRFGHVLLRCSPAPPRLHLGRCRS